MISRKSSGSSRADKAVEPTRSQNITVRWRRSAVGEVGAGPVTLGADSDRTGSVLAAVPSKVPQSAQNFAPIGLKPPQPGHTAGNAAPHAVQNRLPSLVSAPQLGHFMGCPPMLLNR